MALTHCTHPNETHPDPFAITIGNSVSQTCQGEATNFSMAIKDPFNLTPLATGFNGVVPDTYYGNQLEFLRTTIVQTNAYSETIEQAANNSSTLATYPEGNSVADALKIVAQLISGGLQTKI